MTLDQTKNYIQHVKNSTSNNKSFFANSVAGGIEVSHNTFIQPLGPKIGKIQFFILPSLISFDTIIGNDTLKQLNAIIHTKGNYMTLHCKWCIPSKQHISIAVNNINIRTSHFNQDQAAKLKQIIKNWRSLLSEPNEKLTYTRNIKVEIRTTTNEPIYSKSYSYPMSLKTEVETKIKKLVEDGIVRPSRSAYNSPNWIVAKKLDAQGEKKYRMVVVYCKLNSISHNRDQRGSLQLGKQ